MQMSASSIVSALPWMTCSTLATIVENRSANEVADVRPAICLATGVSLRTITSHVCRVRTVPSVSDLALAVDVGGTKLAAGLVTADGELVARAQAPTPRTNDAEALFAALCAVVAAVGGNGEVAVCGVGCGGPMTAGGELVSPL